MRINLQRGGDNEMRSIPFGYRIINGTAVIDEKEGAAIRQAFELYLSGKSLATIGTELGINKYHTGVAKILENQKYLGTDFYPAIIDIELFDRVQTARAASRKKHARPGRIHLEAEVKTEFKMEPRKQALSDPFEQAQYVYGLIQAKE